MPDKDNVLSEDPFNLYDTLNKRKDSGDDLKYPPGFTPSVFNMEEVNEKEKGATSNEVNEHVNSTSNKLEESVSKGKLSSNNNVCSKRFHTGGSILQLMDELVKETKMESMELVTIKTLWGNSSFDYALNSSLGNSRGILCVWEPTLFVKDKVTSSDNFLVVMGTWVPSSSKLLIISVYAPQDLTKKRVLYDYILRLIDRWDGNCVIMRDFNKVRTEQERYGSVFNVQGANAFNSFISLASLIDLPFNVSYSLSNESNSKRSQLAIRGTLVDGEWIVYPLAVKSSFSGIPIDNSLTLSHLFFADDAIFVGKWDSLNIHTIVNVLKCFHLASAIYGEDDALNSPSSLSKRSPWLDIIREVTVLCTKGINLLKFNSQKGGQQSLEATYEFSLKYVWQLIDDSILLKEEVTTRWVKVMPIKINVFAWRVHWDKLPTRLNLSLKGIDISTIVCPLCHASVESGSHIFFSCPMARQLWGKLMRWWELEDIDLASYDD
ncbi:RNA-directed DNA polymerase, eukaryota [Tanacetum coccineum]